MMPPLIAIIIIHYNSFLPLCKASSHDEPQFFSGFHRLKAKNTPSLQNDSTQQSPRAFAYGPAIESPGENPSLNSLFGSGELPFSALPLQGGHFGINASALAKLARPALLGYYAVLEQNQPVRPLDGTHPVCDDQDCLIAHQSGNRLLNLRFIFSIERGCCLIQQDDGRILEQRTRNRDPLSFAAGERRAVLPDHGLVSLRQFFDKLVALRLTRSLKDLLVGSALPADADILHDRIVEQRHILKYKRVG